MSDDETQDPRGDDPTPPSGKRRRVQLRQELDDDVAEGTYANVTSISFSPSEFFVDFARMVPGRDRVKVHSRIILTPAHARRLASVLLDHVARYERAHGAISAPTDAGPDGGVH